MSINARRNKREDHIYSKNNGKSIAIAANYFDKITEDIYNLLHISINSRAYQNSILASSTISNKIKGNQLDIVDLGCGFGDLERFIELSFASPEGINIFAIDKSINIIKIAKSRSHSLKSKVHFIQSDALRVGLKEDIADITFEINLIPYVEKLSVLLTESHRLTRKGGLIVLIFPIRTKIQFWEDYFENLKLNYHDNFNKFLNKSLFKVIESELIYTYPVKDLGNLIKIPIARQIVLEVIK